MLSQIKTSFLFFMFTLFLCVSSFFLSNAAAQTQDGLAFGAIADNYTFETIQVPGIDFLALTASSDFGDYAGYTKSADGEKYVAFTLIGDVFTTYDFPGSENTYFYALGNNGNAAGYYEDSEGHHHGVVLENGELRQYDFPDSIETEIYGISDATGAMTGNIVGADGVRRGFTGERIVEVPGATATYADFINASGMLLGTYIDENGIFRRYAYTQEGEWLFFPIPNAEHLEYVFLHGITDAWVGVYRAKTPGDVPRTYVGNIADELKELRVPGSVVTEGWNINQDLSVVGYYETADGKRHGFGANPIDVDLHPTYADTEFNYVYEEVEVPGINFLAVAASSDYEDYAGYTKSADGGKEIAFTLIDGVFETYDFPGSQKTHFYALGNNGNAAGYYVDSEGNHRGVVLENGELRPYDFPESVQTEIWGISDTTGGLTGNFVDTAGVRRGFSHNEIVEIPGAAATYADFVSPKGYMVGSYIDANGVYYPYWRNLHGNPLPFNITDAEDFEYYFAHGTTDGSVHLIRSKKVGDIPRTYVGQMLGGQHEVQVPGSVRTEGYNINADLSVVGHYETSDGRIRSFVARLAPVDTEPDVQVNITSVAAPAASSYTFKKIDVEGVDFLAVTSSSDYEDYGGYTRRADGEKIVAFTIIDGVFMTYDFPGAQETRFYALGNNGNAAGYYVDSEGRHQGVVLENGELRQYNFPDAVQTQIWGISDAMGALTGNWTDASGIRRGFSGDLIVEYPGAVETYSDFVNSRRLMVGSYVDAEGVYHAYARLPDGRFVPINLEDASTLEYFFVHGINDTGTIVARAKRMGAVPLTYTGSAHEGLEEFKVPGSVSTEGYNINQDGSIVGNYESADGRRYGFIARLAGDDQPVAQPTVLTYTFESIDVPGVDFLAVTASSDFEDYAGYTKSVDGEKIVGFTLIDGVFTTYDFPSSQNTYFYALGNNGNAAGYYEDSNGLHRGVILENGELRQYDFPDAVQTEIYGISDATGALTGNFIDASGVRRGFSGETIIEAPGASATYADFVNASGRIVGGYIDTDGIPHAYVRTPDDRFTTIDVENAAEQEYFFLHGFSDAGIFVGRAKAVNGAPRTYVGTALHGLQELRFPGSISTNGWNINQNSSVVGHYESADGRVHGFIARPADNVAQIDSEIPIADYVFETIEVPGVDFLEVAASNDFGDYAGNTRGPDGKKKVGFTLIDGVFKTYDFPGSLNTYFYALDNTGKAAGHYKGSDDLYHGVIMEDGKLTQYDFPGAIETHIYGLSDETGALSGNIVDAAGVTHAFSGELTITFPGAVNTYGDFVNAAGAVVGSYVDADGMPHGFIRHPDGTFTTIDLPKMPNLQFLFVNTITDVGVIGFRAKAVDDILRSYILLPDGTLYEVRIPGSVSTVVRNVNQDRSIIGYYDSTDGRRLGFVGRPTTDPDGVDFGTIFSAHLSKGLNMLSVPLQPTVDMTARSLAVKIGATTVIALDAANQQFIAWTPNAPTDGFSIEGAKGYIVNLPKRRDVVFTGTAWTNQMEVAAAPAPKPNQIWAFVVNGHLEGIQNFNGYTVNVRNHRTNTVMASEVRANYFAAATVDLRYRSVVQVGDRLELTVVDTNGNIASDKFNFTVNAANLENAVSNRDTRRYRHSETEPSVAELSEPV